MAWLPHDAPAVVETKAHDLEEKATAIVKELEGKTENELRALHAEALTEESDAKKELYALRQRITNLGTHLETNEEVLLKSAKQRVATGMAYLRALEFKLEGRPTTPTPN